MSTSEELEKIVIRAYPKVITILPSAIIAIIFGVIESLPFIGSDPSVQRTLGLAFIFLLTFNLFIISFEFNEAKTFGLFAIIILLIILYILLAQMGIIESGALFNILTNTNIYLSAHAYYLLGFGILFLMFIIWLNKRWDYWIIEPNQVTHRTGIFGRMERFPTQGMKYGIEISDIFEYLLFRSGTLTLYFPSERKIITLHLVPNIKKIERDIQKLMGIIEVEEEEV